MSRLFMTRAMLVLAVLAAGGRMDASPQGGQVGIDQGRESLTAARKFLQGRWILESFEVHPPGKPVIVLKGTGTMVFDDFSNLKMEIIADEKSADLLRSSGVEMKGGTILSDGRVALDVRNRTMTYILEGQSIGAPAAGPLSLKRPRYWEVNGDALTLSTKGEDGTPLSIGRWTRAK